MDAFASRQREELYGDKRYKEGAQLRDRLTASHILRDGEFNIEKTSSKPGFQWSTVTYDDYRRTFQTTGQGKQYDESYKQMTGSDIPIKYEGIPLDTYCHTSMKDAYVDKGVNQKREYIGHNPTTNWPDMTPTLIKDKKLGHSEYKELYIPREDVELHRPQYAKVKTSNVKLPLPFDEKKHKINVNLGSEPKLEGGVQSEASSQFLRTTPKKYDGAGIRRMKEQMEWNSSVFQHGDYNNEDDKLAHTLFQTDFGKKAKTEPFDWQRNDNSEQQLDATIQQKLHFMPKLIESSMSSDTARRDGEDGKKYHINAHFHLGSHADKSMSVYDKDYLPFGSQRKPDRIKPDDAKVLSSNVGSTAYRTSNREDYYGTTGGAICEDTKAIRKANMEKQISRHINFENNADDTKMYSVFSRDFRGPPKDYKTMKPATEKKCEFNFLDSNGMMPHQTKRLLDNTENSDNFRGAAGVSQLVMNSDKARVKSAAKRRLKSGRRAHFVLGTSQLSYNTVSADTFTGKPREDEHIPAAGKTEKPSKEFSHFTMSENTEDMLGDTYAPSIQESRAIKDIYSTKGGDQAMLPTSSTVTMSDFTPIEKRAYTVPQLRQIKAEQIKTGKATAKTHFFHTDTSCRNNYESTTMASFIKPERMSGQVNLSPLY